MKWSHAKGFWLDRLFKEVDRAGLHCLGAGGNLGVAGHEYHLQRKALGPKSCLQLQARGAGQKEVQPQAPGTIRQRIA